MRQSSEWAWSFVTADQLLTNKPCELAFAQLVPSGAVTDTYLYNGAGTKGEKIVALVSAAATMVDFRPAHAVYCHEGLYVDIGSNTTGVFVQWRHVDDLEVG